MQANPDRPRCALLLPLVLFIGLSVGGCNRLKALFHVHTPHKNTIIVDYNADKGVHPKAIYLYNGDSIQWVAAQYSAGQASISSFQIKFEDPAFPGHDTYDDNNNTTPAYVDNSPNEVVVYKYDILITDTNGKKTKADPHVVGGGGL